MCPWCLTVPSIEEVLALECSVWPLHVFLASLLVIPLWLYWDLIVWLLWLWWWAGLCPMGLCAVACFSLIPFGAAVLLSWPSLSLPLVLPTLHPEHLIWGFWFVCLFFSSQVCRFFRSVGPCHDSTSCEFCPSLCSGLWAVQGEGLLTCLLVFE